MAHAARLLSREVVTVGPGESVLAAVEVMKSRRIGCVVVVEGGRLVGVFTERDLVNRVLPEGADVRTAPVSRYMTTAVAAVEASEPLEKVFELLARRRFRHVPITEGGRPVGMVSLSDFAGVLREVFSEPKYVQYFADYFGEKVGPAGPGGPAAA